MNFQTYPIPNIRTSRIIPMAPNIRGNYLVPNTLGLFSRLGNTLKNFNWKNLLTNANKTLNVVNQTIPIIKQTKPMINNIRSMISLTKAFKHEIEKKPINMKKNQINAVKFEQSKSQNNTPIFFI